MDAPAPSPATPKPGWRTSEFWLHLAAIIVSALIASGVIPTSGTAAQVVAIIATVLSSLGYTVVRSQIKIASSAAQG